jgi:hypothetical protein
LKERVVDILPAIVVRTYTVRIGVELAAFHGGIHKGVCTSNDAGWLAGGMVIGQERGEGSSDTAARAMRRTVVDPRKSLAVTDQTILANFAFSRVMKQLVDQAHVPGMTELLLFQRAKALKAAIPSPGSGRT